MRQAPLRDVVEIREMTGPRGGTRHVMKLSCGCLVWGGRPRKQVRCVGCWWEGVGELCGAPGPQPGDRCLLEPGHDAGARAGIVVHATYRTQRTRVTWQERR